MKCKLHCLHVTVRGAGTQCGGIWQGTASIGINLLTGKESLAAPPPIKKKKKSKFMFCFPFYFLKIVEFIIAFFFLTEEMESSSS